MDLTATVYVITDGWDPGQMYAAFADRALAEEHAGQVDGAVVEELPLLQSAPTRIVEHIYAARFDDGIAGHVGVTKATPRTEESWSYDPPGYPGWADGQPRTQQHEPRPRLWAYGLADWGYIQVCGIDQARAEQAFNDRLAEIRERTPGE